MTYEVLARKWRPQQFDEVVGQAHVTDTLKNAIEQQRVAHAYLFVGPRGIGKTSSARILAKALNCRNGPTVRPCDECESCREIMGGRALDMIEIDGASNRGIDQARELRENVQYAPTRGPYKIYLIDEVHMLTNEAFNALLKTLEEPPKHVKFLFATTEPQKVPATILSRCQRFDLRKIATTDIIAHLDKIARKEGMEIDADALLAVARGAEGGMRDAESALDQLMAFRGRDIREADVLAVFGLVSRSSMEDLAGAVLKGDVQTMIRLLSTADSDGKDMQRMMYELIEYFKNLLIIRYVGDEEVDLDLTGAQKTVLRDQGEGIHPDRVLRIVEILTESEGRLRYALSRRTLVETALIRCARAATVVTLEEILGQLNALKNVMGIADGDGQKKK